jgi:hypothetical protein
MSLWCDFDNEMKRLPIDPDTADRLLAGSIAPQDAPPGYEGVAALLATTADGSLPGELSREAETIAAVAAVVRSSQTQLKKPPRRSTMPRVKLASALVAAALVGTTGLAFAGSLPGAAQDVASEMLAKVGVTVPGPNSHAGDHPAVRGKSAETTSESSTSGKGSEISGLATSTELSGVEKGAAISTAASGGKSQAGQHGEAAADHGAPIETPNGGGTGTAETASGGQSAEGTSTADSASDGHSAAGSQNAAAGQAHRP